MNILEISLDVFHVPSRFSSFFVANDCNCANLDDKSDDAAANSSYSCCQRNLDMIDKLLSLEERE